MNLVYAYPWDIVGDPAAPERIAALGADGVALAAAYHTVRAATPFHPAHRVVDARHAACYVPLRSEAWRGRRLAPAAPDWMPGPDPFGAARDALRAAGLPVHAWTVLTHSTHLGSRAPDLAVRNAFGDTYPYALCPSSEEVADYCAVLVREIAGQGRPDGMVLEACGPLGLRHGGHHEKTDGADWTGVQEALLSLCFCPRCADAYARAGTDPADLRRDVRAALDPQTGAAPASVAEAVGDHAAAAVADARSGTAAGLRTRLAATAREDAPGMRVTLHASADPLATGPFATVAPRIGAGIDAVVGTCFTPGPDADAGLRALRRLADAEPGTAVGAYLQALPPQRPDPDAFAAVAAAARVAGADELHLYHAGLASAARRHAIAAVLSERAPSESK